MGKDEETFWRGVTSARKLPGLLPRKPKAPKAKPDEGPPAEPGAVVEEVPVSESDMESEGSDDEPSSDSEESEDGSARSTVSEESEAEGGGADDDMDGVDRKVDHKVELDGIGSIVYYTSKERFVAYCGRAAHSGEAQPCSRERTTMAVATAPEKGRPLGFLMAWLLDAESWDSRALHCNKAICMYSEEKRIEGRETLRVLPGTEKLFLLERRKREGEPEEPLKQP